MYQAQSCQLLIPITITTLTEAFKLDKTSVDNQAHPGLRHVIKLLRILLAVPTAPGALSSCDRRETLEI